MKKCNYLIYLDVANICQKCRNKLPKGQCEIFNKMELNYQKQINLIKRLNTKRNDYKRKIL